MLELGKLVRKSIFIQFGIVIMLTCLAIGSTPVTSADTESGTETIASGYYIAFPIEANMALRIEYDITVINGPRTDVILTDQNGYYGYNSLFSSTSYLVDGSRLDTAHAIASITVEEGTWYLIIDNTMMGSAASNGQSVTISYDISTSVAGLSLGNGGYINIFVVIFLVVLVLFIVVAVAYALTKKGGKRGGAYKVPVYGPQTYPGIDAGPAQEGVRFCPGCGQRTSPDAAYCERCGRGLR